MLYCSAADLTQVKQVPEVGQTYSVNAPIVFFKSLCTNPSFRYNSPNFQPNDLIFGDIRAVNKIFTKI